MLRPVHMEIPDELLAAYEFQEPVLRRVHMEIPYERAASPRAPEARFAPSSYGNSI